MKNNYLSHLFVPPEKNIVERITDVADDKLSRLFGRNKSPKRKFEKAKNGMVLYGLQKSRTTCL